MGVSKGQTQEQARKDGEGATWSDADVGQTSYRMRWSLDAVHGEWGWRQLWWAGAAIAGNLDAALVRRWKC